MDVETIHWRRSTQTYGSPMDEVVRSLRAVDTLEKQKKAIETEDYSGLNPNQRQNLRYKRDWTEADWQKAIQKRIDVARDTYNRTAQWFRDELGIETWEALLASLDPEKVNKKAVAKAIEAARAALDTLENLVSNSAL